MPFQKGDARVWMHQTEVWCQNEEEPQRPKAKCMKQKRSTAEKEGLEVILTLKNVGPFDVTFSNPSHWGDIANLEEPFNENKIWYFGSGQSGNRPTDMCFNYFTAHYL